jgi:hypothetical protein
MTLMKLQNDFARADGQSADLTLNTVPESTLMVDHAM